MLDELTPEARRHLRRNFILGVVNGAAFSAADVFQDINLVLSVFINRLTGSNFLVGLLLPIRMGGWFLPQLMLSGIVQASPAKLRFYRLAALFRGTAAIGLGIAPFVVRDSRVLLALVFCFVTAFSMGGGLSGIAFMDIVGKTIPSRMRGRYFALRMFLGGILALASSFLVRYMLQEPPGFPFPTNYGVLLSVSAAGIVISLSSFSLVKEPTDGGAQPRVSLLNQLRRASGLPRRNHNYRYFLLTRVALMLAEVASPFYMIYASKVLGLPESLAGVFLILSTIANIVSTYTWGTLSDRAGNKAVMQLVSAMACLPPALALVAGLLAGRFSTHAHLVATVFFGLIFAILGAMRTGTFIGGMNYLLDVAPPADRPIYIGLSNTVIGIASLVSASGGAITELVGYNALFLIALGFYLLANVAISQAGEPREQTAVHQSGGNA